MKPSAVVDSRWGSLLDKGGEYYLYNIKQCKTAWAKAEFEERLNVRTWLIEHGFEHSKITDKLFGCVKIYIDDGIDPKGDLYRNLLNIGYTWDTKLKTWDKPHNDQTN